MGRTIAKIVHDLKPPMETISEVVQVLEQMAIHLTDKKYSQEFREALHTVNSLTATVVKYIAELDEEVRSGIDVYKNK